MIFNVAQLMKSSVGDSLIAEIYEEQIQLDDDLKLTNPLQGEVRLRRINQGILVDGTLDLTLDATCHRCLKKFEHPVHVILDERFFPTIDIVTGLRLPVSDEEDVFLIDDHHILDLSEAIRQRILLAMPMVTLCKEDCAGLCPQCGHDLNLGPCDCKPVEESSFSVLKSLLQQE